MSRPRPKSPLRWAAVLILFAAAGLITLFLVDRSPSRTLQRLGVSDEVIHKIRKQAKRTRFRWSVDSHHPSYFRATFRNETNHVVPQSVAGHIRKFVCQNAEDSLYRIDQQSLRRSTFDGYGISHGFELPDGRILYTHLISRTWESHLLLQIHDPKTGRTSSSPLTLVDRDFSKADISLVPHDNRSLLTIRRLRTDNQYEIGIRSTHYYGTMTFRREYTYYLIDDDLNLHPILPHTQESWAYVGTTFMLVNSEIESTGDNTLLERFTAKLPKGTEKAHDVGYRRYEWNSGSNQFARSESRITYEGSDLDWIYRDSVLPELAPGGVGTVEPQ